MTQGGRYPSAVSTSEITMKKIDWTKLAAISEIIGMLAVVISLIFVGVSIRQNTAALEAPQLNFLADLSDRYHSDKVTNPDIYDLLEKFENNQQLTDAEESRLKDQLWRGLLIWEELYDRYRRGLIEDDIFQYEHKAMLRFVRTELPQSWWEDDMRDWGGNPELILLIDAAYDNGND